MFQANIDCGRLADALNAVSVLVEECKIQLNEDGISIRAVDPANVGMVDLFLDTGAFESYSATDGSVIGVNLERFQDIIGMGSSGDIMSLELDEETRKLNLEVDGLSYTLALIDPDSIRQEPDIPDLDLSSELVAEQGQLDRGITAADMVSDHITLSVEPEENAFYIEAEGDTDDVDLKLNEDELVSLTPGDAESMFSLDYLKDMNKGMPNGGEITAELGSEFPAKFHFKVADGTGHVTYMLAPRIQSD